MGGQRNLLKQILGIVGLILLVVALVVVFQWAQQSLFLYNGTNSGAEAYPPPTGKLEPTGAIQSNSSPYPGSEEINKLTPVAQVSPEPPSTLVPIPPQGWPTDQPWPPEDTIMTPAPTALVLPFPTPEELKLSYAEALPKTMQIWFPYYPKADVHPELHGIKWIETSKKWEMEKLPINLDIPVPLSGPDPGPILLDLQISPNSSWLVADFAYRGSQLIDLSTGHSKVLSENLPSTYWKFFAWQPTGSQLLASSNQEFPTGVMQLMNVEMAKAQAVTFSDVKNEEATVRAMAYSPDGKNLGIAIVEPAKANVRKTEIAVVYLQGNEKRNLAEINGGASFVDYSLQWSPDGTKLVWIVDVYDESGVPETQLWLADLETGSTKQLAVLGKAVQYNNPPAWSPDGSTIAILKPDANISSKETGDNVSLIELKTGEEKQITNLSSRPLSHLQWLPDGKWLTFSISMGNYGEIWITNLDGSVVFPLAGPTLPNAPYIFMNGGN
jgi:hypothetical protein